MKLEIKSFFTLYTDKLNSPSSFLLLDLPVTLSIRRLSPAAYFIYIFLYRLFTALSPANCQVCSCNVYYSFF